MRNINGIFILDKPIGMSSNMALQKVKRLFRAKKAGHTGSLDPLATGLLPICFGEATKFSQFLLDADKTYAVTMRLGIRTTTSDAEGDIVCEKPVPADLTVETIDRLFDAFRGETQQIPSMFSALKHNGKPLYELARQGITVERESRPITLFSLTVTAKNGADVDFTVHCSKGTYVRTLVDDFGELLGCGAHVIALRRLSVGPYQADMMAALEDVDPEKTKLLPVDTAVTHWPTVMVSDSNASRLLQGQQIMLPGIEQVGAVRVVTTAGQFIGVAELTSEGRLTAKRMVTTEHAREPER